MTDTTKFRKIAAILKKRFPTLKFEEIMGMTEKILKLIEDDGPEPPTQSGG